MSFATLGALWLLSGSCLGDLGDLGELLDALGGLMGALGGPKGSPKEHFWCFPSNCRYFQGVSLGGPGSAKGWKGVGAS